MSTDVCPHPGVGNVLCNSIVKAKFAADLPKGSGTPLPLWWVAEVLEKEPGLRAIHESAHMEKEETVLCDTSELETYLSNGLSAVNTGKLTSFTGMWCLAAS